MATVIILETFPQTSKYRHRNPTYELHISFHSSLVKTKTYTEYQSIVIPKTFQSQLSPLSKHVTFQPRYLGQVYIQDAHLGKLTLYQDLIHKHEKKDVHLVLDLVFKHEKKEVHIQKMAH